MRKSALLYLFALCLLAFTAAGQTVVPIGADGNDNCPPGDSKNWKTDLYLRNLTAGPVTQKIGRIVFAKPGFDPIVIEPTYTLAGGETKRILEASKNFDERQHESDPCRNYILKLEPGIEATAYLKFHDGFLKFEVNSLPSPLLHGGESSEFHRIATSYTPPTGTWVLILNRNAAAVPIIFRAFGPKKIDGIYPSSDQHVDAPVGISIAGVQALLEEGGSVRACLVTCVGGIPGSFESVHVFAITGTPDGGMMGVRYPEPPQ